MSDVYDPCRRCGGGAIITVSHQPTDDGHGTEYLGEDCPECIMQATCPWCSSPNLGYLQGIGKTVCQTPGCAWGDDKVGKAPGGSPAEEDTSPPEPDYDDWELDNLKGY